MKVDLGWGPCLVTLDKPRHWLYLRDGKWYDCNRKQDAICNEQWDKFLIR